MALCLVATGVSGASRSTRHSAGHSHHAKRKLPAAPTPERYQEIQQALAARGYYKGPVNGTWNSDSVDALKRFQADQNLPPDGKLTSLSLIAMGLGPKRSGPSAPPATSVAPVTVQSNPTPAPQAPAGAH
jgi:peptidoglycan hydrolase-like protein with peptidoglycan-binding domain